MVLYEKIQSDMYTAMKAGEKEKGIYPSHCPSKIKRQANRYQRTAF